MGPGTCISWWWGKALDSAVGSIGADPQSITSIEAAMSGTSRTR